MKVRVELRASRLAELDRSGLVPDDVARSQGLDQHDHVHRVDGGVHAPAEDGADVVTGSPAQRQVDSHFAIVVSDVRDAGARTSVGGKQVEAPACEFSPQRFRHGRPYFSGFAMSHEWPFLRSSLPVGLSSAAGRWMITTLPCAPHGFSIVIPPLVPS